MDLSIVMPILVAIIIFIIAGMLIVVYYKTNSAKSLKTKAFEALAQELRADHTAMKSELRSIRETLDSIHKMMKEIE